MTPGSLLYQVQRDWKRGFAAAWNDRFVSRRILKWRNPYADQPHEAIPVHVLTGRDDWLTWVSVAPLAVLTVSPVTFASA